MTATAGARRAHYRENIEQGFDALADLYYAYWGEFFHLAVFADGDDPTDFAAAYERTHERYFDAIGGATAGRILELACGGGALSAWMAARTSGEVVGVDLSGVQLAHARRRLAGGRCPNLRFVRHDIMDLARLDIAPAGAAICLDAACYLPDRPAALRAIATRLRPGARFLLVDWCRPERVTRFQRELILEPLERYWGIAGLETVRGYRRGFAGAGLRILAIDDLSERVTPNWELGYRAALRALSEPMRLRQLLTLAASAARHGPRIVQAAKDQFQVALLAKAAADAGALRYVAILAERE